MPYFVSAINDYLGKVHDMSLLSLANERMSERDALSYLR
jgi:hypothetical protein